MSEKPTDEATIEPFNGGVRRERLSEDYFSTLAEEQILLGISATSTITADRTGA